MAKMTGLEPLLSSLGEESLQVRGLAVWLLAKLPGGGRSDMFLLCCESFPPAGTEVQEPCQAPCKKMCVAAGVSGAAVIFQDAGSLCYAVGAEDF